MVQNFLSTERDFTGFFNLEGPYILPLWNPGPKRTSPSWFRGPNSIIVVYMDPLPSPYPKQQSSMPQIIATIMKLDLALHVINVWAVGSIRFRV